MFCKRQMYRLHAGAYNQGSPRLDFVAWNIGLGFQVLISITSTDWLHKQRPLSTMELAVLWSLLLVGSASAHRLCTKCIPLSDLLAEGYGIEISAKGLYEI